jgi:hypothetical protein
MDPCTRLPTAVREPAPPRAAIVVARRRTRLRRDSSSCQTRSRTLPSALTGSGRPPTSALADSGGAVEDRRASVRPDRRSEPQLGGRGRRRRRGGRGFRGRRARPPATEVERAKPGGSPSGGVHRAHFRALGHPAPASRGQVQLLMRTSSGYGAPVPVSTSLAETRRRARAVAEQLVEQATPRRIADGRPQVVVDDDHHGEDA